MRSKYRGGFVRSRLQTTRSIRSVFANSITTQPLPVSLEIQLKLLPNFASWMFDNWWIGLPVIEPDAFAFAPSLASATFFGFAPTA